MCTTRAIFLRPRNPSYGVFVEIGNARLIWNIMRIACGFPILRNTIKPSNPAAVKNWRFTGDNTYRVCGESCTKLNSPIGVRVWSNFRWETLLGKSWFAHWNESMRFFIFSALNCAPYFLVWKGSVVDPTGWVQHLVGISAQCVFPKTISPSRTFVPQILYKTKFIRDIYKYFYFFRQRFLYIQVFSNLMCPCGVSPSVLQAAVSEE